MLRASLAIVAMTWISGAAVAQERGAEAMKQVAAAEAAWKQAELARAAPVETSDLIVLTSLPATKAKAVADAGQKAYELARKALQYQDDDKMWPGKLTVYFFDNRDDYTKYMRKVALEKPSAKETVRLSLRGNEPHVIVALPAAMKQTDADMANEMAAAMATTLLKHKAGGTGPTAANLELPDWLTIGFVRNIQGRMDGQAAKLTGYRARTRQALAKLPKGPMPPSAMSLWSGERPKEFEALAVSLTEYFVYGPEAARFSKFLVGYRPSDGQQNPTTDQALELLELKADTLDKAWKSWIIKGK